MEGEDGDVVGLRGRVAEGGSCCSNVVGGRWLMDWVRSKPKSSLVGDGASTTPSVTRVRVWWGRGPGGTRGR
jgi:hypothetical protein